MQSYTRNSITDGNGKRGKPTETNSRAEADDVPFETRFVELKAKLEQQFAESARLEAEIRKNWGGWVDESRYA